MVVGLARIKGGGPLVNVSKQQLHDDMLMAWKEIMLRIEIIIHNHTALHIDKLRLGMKIACWNLMADQIIIPCEP